MAEISKEMWNCPCSTDYFAGFAENFDDKESSDALPYSMLSEIASREEITVVGGSIPDWSENQLYNTCCVFGSNEELLAKHRKIHLFDVEIPGDISFKESNIYSAREEPTVVDTGLLEFSPSF